MKFEALDATKHNRKSFDCGVDALNLYLQKFANQDQKRSLTRIYVLADAEKIIGYYSLSAHSVSRDNLPEGIKTGHYKDLPFLLLGRLAVDKAHQGQGYGDALIYHAFKMTANAAEQFGLLGIIVEAKDDNASRFYEEFGFIKLEASPNKLVLPLSAIKALVSK